MDKIEFYKKDTGEAVPTGDHFVLNGNEVWRDNYECYESQPDLIGFENCIVRCEQIGWRVASE